MLLPKNKPLRDSAHLARVREMPCVACCKDAPSHAHHIRMGWYRAGEKPPDDWCVPLCHEDHSELHQIGEQRFWSTRVAAGDGFIAEIMRAYARSLYAGSATPPGEAGSTGEADKASPATTSSGPDIRGPTAVPPGSDAGLASPGRPPADAPEDRRTELTGEIDG